VGVAWPWPDDTPVHKSAGTLRVARLSPPSRLSPVAQHQLGRDILSQIEKEEEEEEDQQPLRIPGAPPPLL
jgi:hypothetical protein